MRGPVLLHDKPASLPAGVNLNAVQRWVHEGQGGREEKGRMRYRCASQDTRQYKSHFRHTYTHTFLQCTWLWPPLPDAKMAVWHRQLSTLMFTPEPTPFVAGSLV